MKVIQINVVYGEGSTGKIVKEIHKNLLDKGITSLVYYGRGDVDFDYGIHKMGSEFLMQLQSLRSRITGYAYGGCYLSTRKIINAIEKEKPDIVHLHCLNGYFVNIYKLMNYLKKMKIKTVLTLHAEFMYTGGCTHTFECEQWKKGCCLNRKKCPQFNKLKPKSWFFNRCNKEWNLMKESFDGFDNLIICPVSGWLSNKASQSIFMKDKIIHTVTNGLNTKVFKPTEYEKLKEIHKLSDEKIILHVTPDFKSTIKGGKYVLELAQRLIEKNVKFIVIGYTGDSGDLPQNVIPVQTITVQNELAAYYSMSDITLLTSKKETFSMVCAESLSCGTPVVGFFAGGPETISIEKYSKFVEQGNLNQLETEVEEWLDKKNQFNNQIYLEAHEKYSEKTMSRKYIELYSKLLDF